MAILSSVLSNAYSNSQNSNGTYLYRNKAHKASEDITVAVDVSSPHDPYPAEF